MTSCQHRRSAPARRISRLFVRCLVAGAAVWSAAPPALAGEDAPVSPGQAYQLALEARTARDYPATLAWLRQAAEGGDPAAQELLGSMLLAGPALHGGAIAADPCEAAHWSRLAAAQGSAVGRHQLRVLNGMREVSAGGEGCGPGR